MSEIHWARDDTVSFMRQDDIKQDAIGNRIVFGNLKDESDSLYNPSLSTINYDDYSDSGVEICQEDTKDELKTSVIESEKQDDDVSLRERQNKDTLNTIRNLFPSMPTNWADDDEEDETFYSAITTPTPTIHESVAEEVETLTDQDRIDGSESDSISNNSVDVGIPRHLETASDIVDPPGLCACRPCKGDPVYKIEDFREDLEGPFDPSYMGRIVASQKVYSQEQHEEFERRVRAVKEVVNELEPHNYIIIQDLDYWLACKETEATPIPLSAHSKTTLTGRTHHPIYEYGRSLSARKYKPHGSEPKRFNEMSCTFFKKTIISGRKDAQWGYLFWYPMHFKMLGHSDLPTILEDDVLTNIKERPDIAPEAQTLDLHNFFIYDYQFEELALYDSETTSADDSSTSSHAMIAESSNQQSSVLIGSPSFVDTTTEAPKTSTNPQNELAARIAVDLDREISDLGNWFHGELRTWDCLQHEIDSLVHTWEDRPASFIPPSSPRPSTATLVRGNSEDEAASPANTEQSPDTSFATTTFTISTTSTAASSSIALPPSCGLNIGENVISINGKPNLDMRPGTAEEIIIKTRRTSGMKKAMKNLRGILSFSSLRRKVSSKH